MRKNEERLRRNKLYAAARNKVLKSEDPEIWIDQDDMEVSLVMNKDGVQEYLEMSLGIAMWEIHEYVEVCFGLGDNPLKHLRRNFPDFTWKFHESVELNELASVLAAVDYIWVMYSDFREGIVTAKQTATAKSRVLCFLDNNNDASGMNEMIKSFLGHYVPGIRFVPDDNK